MDDTLKYNVIHFWITRCFHFVKEMFIEREHGNPRIQINHLGNIRPGNWILNFICVILLIVHTKD